jgi:hypothetical protein
MNKYTHIYIYCKHKCTHTYILIYIYIITYHFHEIAPLYPFVAYFYVFPLSMFDYRWSVRFILLHFGVSRTLLQAPNYRFNQLLKLHIARGDLLRIPEKKTFGGAPILTFPNCIFFWPTFNLKSNMMKSCRGRTWRSWPRSVAPKIIPNDWAISHISPAKQPSNHWILQLLSFLGSGPHSLVGCPIFSMCLCAVHEFIIQPTSWWASVASCRWWVPSKKTLKWRQELQAMGYLKDYALAPPSVWGRQLPAVGMVSNGHLGDPRGQDVTVQRQLL